MKQLVHQTKGLRAKAHPLLCLLMVLAILVPLVAPVNAAIVNVTDNGDGTYTADGGTPVYPITAPDGWSVSVSDAGGNVYQAGSAYYAPTGAAVTFSLITLLGCLPTEPLLMEGTGAKDVSVTMIDPRNITGTMIMGGEGAALSITSATVVRANDLAGDRYEGIDGVKYKLDTALGYYVPVPMVQITFAQDPNCVIRNPRTGAPNTAPFDVENGTNFTFNIEINPLYRLPESSIRDIFLDGSIAGVPKTSDELFTELGVGVVDGVFRGTVPAALTTANLEIFFRLDPDKLVRLVGVAPQTGTGYRLETVRGAMAGSMESIEVELTLDAAYSNSTPTLSIAGGGYEVNHENAGTTWFFYIAPLEGTVIPDADLAVTVSGVVANPTGGGGPIGGGGDDDSGVVETVIRVENELNENKSSSDTILWPAGTKEKDGVSTTTVTDAELAALLELAKQHEADVAGLDGEGIKEGIIKIEDGTSATNQSYLLDLTAGQMETLAQEGWDLLTMSTPAGDFSLNQDSLDQAVEQEGDVELSLTRLDVQGRPGVDATLTVGKEKVTVLDSSYGFRLLIPYTPAEGEDLNAITILYIHEDGTEELVTECHYDAALGGVVFHTSHLSKFGVSYRPAAFADVTAKHWANPYVTFLAARGVVSGYQGGNFRPDAAATRGEALAMFTKALSAAKLPANPVQVYSDLPVGSSVAGAASWVYYNNLASAITANGKFRSGEAITREDMATLLYNISSGIGLRLRSKGLDTQYTDKGAIAPYAKTAVERLRAASILEMAQNLKFNPKATLTRGELAQITAALLSNL